MFLEERDQEVHGQVNVLDKHLVSHANIADGNAEAQNLLHLELDGGLQVIDFLLHVVGVGQKSGELASLVQTGSQQTWNLLDQRL